MCHEANARVNRFYRCFAPVPRIAVVLLALVSLAGCAHGMGDLLGGQPQRYPDSYGSGYGSERIVGTVQTLDRGYNRIVLRDESRGYGGGAIELFFDRDTRLVYRGQEQAVEGLEPGDRISVDAVRSGNGLLARHVEVIANVRESGGAYGGGYPAQPGGYPAPQPYPGGAQGVTELQGTVGQVDVGRRRILLTTGGYGAVGREVIYDELTRVEYRGQYVRVEQLEPGDVLRVRGRAIGPQFIAEHIWVEANARSR